MAKYIDTDLLRKEIEKRLKNIRDYMSGTGMRYKGPKYFKAQGKESAYDALLSIIDSLQQEQPEVDLEKEIETSIRLLNGLHTLENNKSWYKGRYEELKEFARHFYELGASKNK